MWWGFLAHLRVEWLHCNAGGGGNRKKTNKEIPFVVELFCLPGVRLHENSNIFAVGR